MRHLYVHIPFCRSRCAYCDFVSEPLAPHLRAGTAERYLEALRAELRERALGTFDTVFMGGGTPTVLPADSLVELTRFLAAKLRRSGDYGAKAAHRGAPEFTIEANPGTIDALLLERLAGAGVTRLSLGVQSFAPALRAALGRRVSQEQIMSALDAIREVDWSEWNLDLVFGIPGQTWEDACMDIDRAVTAGPTHISLYDLTYTPAYSARVERVTGAREAAVAFAERRYADAVARLDAAGYQRYEVSNFALRGHECRHNQAYWRGEDYVGVGTAAVSTTGGKRRTNPRSVKEYLEGRDPEIEAVSELTALWETAMLGLRTREGVEESAVLPVLAMDVRDHLLAEGLLERRCGKLRLNKRFLDVSNAVISALLVSPEE